MKMVLFRGVLASIMVFGSAAASSRLDVIDLPMGFFPEGITLGNEWTAYVGSLVDGSIWKGDLSTGQGEVVLSGDGSMAVGMDYDRRSGFLYVGGGSSGTARIYDDDFVLVANISLAVDGEDSFVNDVIVTKTAAYFTDSRSAKLYQVAINRDDGMLVNGPDDPATILALSGFPNVEGTFNANGIEVTDDNKMLIVANSQAGELYAVDPDTGAANVIDLGGVAVNGDGLILRKNTLWVLDNGVTSGSSKVLEISLSSNLTCGSVAPRALTNELFDSPTTGVRKGNSLYVVNAKFSTPLEDVPSTEYEIVRVDRDSGEYVCAA